MLLIMLVSLLIMGSLVSAAFVFFFQKRTALGFVFLVLGIIAIVAFYYAVSVGWITAPDTPVGGI